MGRNQYVLEMLLRWFIKKMTDWHRGVEHLEPGGKPEGPDWWVDSNFPLLGRYFWTTKRESKCSAFKFLLPPLRETHFKMLAPWPSLREDLLLSTGDQILRSEHFQSQCSNTSACASARTSSNVLILAPAVLWSFILCVLRAQRVSVGSHTAHRGVPPEWHTRASCCKSKWKTRKWLFVHLKQLFF